jgi:hypothetical protein
MAKTISIKKLIFRKIKPRDAKKALAGLFVFPFL